MEVYSVAKTSFPAAPVKELDPQKNVYIKNFGSSFSDKKLPALFDSFGEISSCMVAKTPDVKSKRFGFVTCKTRESAQVAL
ncbi:hypothetical protein L596_013722 [Steinernema carpocapsae]|uniref:RRM domain-containing protein n=1 Tax=Steinernema carpocapsae TaxID=34508 RepID=A0A4U5P226_STECR|nr:hypothetical protein L596_013722 [Steinernema carpocapsae]